MAASEFVPPERRQHDIIGSEVVATSAYKRATVARNLTARQIDYCHHRRLISKPQFDAADRLHTDYVAGAMEARVTASYSAARLTPPAAAPHQAPGINT